MTIIYYSPSTGGFYQSDIHPNPPPDGIEISKTTKQVLLDGTSSGKIISVVPNGALVLTDPVPVDDELSEGERFWRNSELIISDIHLNKAQDSDPKAKGSIADWRVYRKALRSWPEHKDFPNRESRPVSPLIKE